MANIDIQKKKGPGVWPFVIGALALVLVIWAVVEFTGNDTMDTTAPATTEQQQWETQPPPPPPPGPGVAPDPAAPGTQPGTQPGATQPGTLDPAGTTPGATDPATQGTLPGAQPGTTPDNQTGGTTGAGGTGNNYN